MTNLTLGIGLQGKPNDYTGLYAKAQAQKAAQDAAQRKADEAALKEALKDVEVDLERVHPALREEYRQNVARIYNDIQGEFQRDPRGAISQVRRKMIDYQSMLNSYLTSSDALFTIEKSDPSKLNIPDDLVREFRNALNYGTVGLLNFFERHKDRFGTYGISITPPSAEGYAPEIAAVLVPRADLEKNFQAIGNQLGIDFNQVVQEYRHGNKTWLEFARDNEQVMNAAISFFSNPVNLRNAMIRGIDIFDDQGNLDPNKATKWAANLLQGRVESVTSPSGRGGGGSQDRSVAFEGQGLKLFAFGNDYDVETYGGYAVPNRNVTITIGKGTFTSEGKELDPKFWNQRTLTVNNLQSLLVYKGEDIEIEEGARVPDGKGGFTIVASRFTIKSGMPVPRAWLNSSEFSHLLRGKVYEQKFLVGKVDSPGTEYGSLGIPEGGVYVPITDAIKAKILSTYSGEDKIADFLSDITPKRVSFGGASRQTGGTSRPSQSRSDTPDQPSSGGTPKRGSKESVDELRRKLGMI